MRRPVSGRDAVRSQVIDALEAQEIKETGIPLLRQRFDPVVVLNDALTDRFDGSQQRFERGLQLWTQALGFLRIHVAHVAAAQAFTVALGQPACRVDQPRSRPHQSGTCPDHRQISLRLRAAMLHRIQQLGIDPGQPAKLCASSRSSFFRLSPISRTLRAFATITSCPNSLSKRLIQGEWVPISSPIRLRGMAPNTSRKAFAVVRTRCSSCMWPASSNTQYQLLRSPRSNPIVNFCCTEKFLLCCVTAVLLFFIAGLLYLLRFERVDNLGAYSIPSS